MRRILPTLLALITGKDRYFPVIEWSSNSWTHNAFRVFEMLFGREVGIRFENATQRNADGSTMVFFGTLEAFLAHTEADIRARISRIPRPSLVKVYIPTFSFAYAGPMPAGPSPYLFAVAFNAVTSTSGYSQSTGFTLSHTTSGSDRAVVGSLQLGGSTPATQYTSVAMTYAGNSMTGNSGADVTLTNRRSMSFAGLNATTGANNVATSWGGGGTEARLLVSSYTGVDQSAGINAWGENSANSGTTLTVSTTTTVEDCWLVGGIFVREGGSGDITLSAGTVRSQDQISGTGDRGPVAAGATSLPWVAPSGALNGGSTASLVALAPAVAAGPANLKSRDTNLKANIKTIDSNPIANVKSLDTNT